MAMYNSHFGRNDDLVGRHNKNEHQDMLMMNAKYSSYGWSWRTLIFIILFAVVLLVSPLALPPLPPPPPVLLLVPVGIMLVLLVLAFSPSYSPELVLYNNVS
ncbi:hypothetical protein LIER_26579 [Lithospermum erythrorhizon]|uniref:Uncharacterized protein n=1 Tax=Lithospermum erythrorhizon TaxID=34254 RepID=A0AAV3RCA6_LITER